MKPSNPTPTPATQPRQPHVTEEEIILCAFGEADDLLQERAEAHARNCFACRELLRFHTDIFRGVEATELGAEAVPDEPRPLRFHTDMVCGAEVIDPGVAMVPDEPILAWAAKPGETPGQPSPAVPFAELNARFSSLPVNLRGRMVIGLMDPHARPWFRACHALVHDGASAEGCGAELLAALDILPLLQREVARLHHAVALVLRSRDGSSEAAAKDLDALASQPSLPPALVHDIAQELLTDPAVLTEIIAKAHPQKLWHGDLRPTDSETRVGVILMATSPDDRYAQPTVAFLTLEVVPSRVGETPPLCLYPVPAIALWDRDPAFQEAEAAAVIAAKSALPEGFGAQVRWRLTRHVEGPLPRHLCGGSLGLAFAFLLRRLFAGADEPITRVDLAGVAFTGLITGTGAVLPVGSVLEKALGQECFDTVVTSLQNIEHPHLCEHADALATRDGGIHILRVANVESVAGALELDHQTRWQGFDFALPAPQADFVGRAELTGEIHRFIHEAESGYGVIVGGMGSGKTSFMKETIRRLAADQRPMAFHIVSSQPGAACRSESVAKKIYFHLRRELHTPEPVEWAGWGIEQKLGELLKYLSGMMAPDGRKILILIDAADQIELPPGQALVPDVLPAELPPGILCIISSGLNLGWLRDRTFVREFFSIGVKHDGMPLCSNDWKDVLDYLRQQKTYALGESLFEAIRQHAEPPIFFTATRRLAELKSSPPNKERMAEYLQDPKWWAAPSEDLIDRRLSIILTRVAPDGAKEREAWDALGVIAVSRAPVCEEELRGLRLWQQGFTDVIMKEAASFFEPFRSGLPRHQQPFAFDHQGYPRMIREKLGDAGYLRCHRVLGEACFHWRELHGMAQHYALRHAPAHLRRAGLWDELYELLTDFDYLAERMKQRRPAVGDGELAASTPQDLPQRLAARVLRDFERALLGQPCFPDAHRWRPALEALHRALEASASILHEHPHLLVQQLYNELIWDWRETDLGRKLEAAIAQVGHTVLKCRSRPAPASSGVRRHLFKGHRKVVNCVALSPDEKSIASASADKTVFVWDVGTGEVRHVLREHTAPVRSVAWSHDGSLLASLAEEVRLWNPETGAGVGAWPAHGGTTLAFSPVADLLAVADKAGGVRLFSAVEKREIAVLRARGVGVRCMAFSRDGRWLVTGTGDAANSRGTLELYDIVNRAHARTVASLPYWVEAVTFCCDDKTIATGGGDKTGEVKLYSMEGSGPPRTLPLHRKGILGLAISPTGVLATGSYDLTVGLHDLNTAAPLRTGLAHCEVIRSVAISREGTLVISGGADHAVIAWHLGKGPAILASTSAPARADSAHDHKIHAIRFSPDGLLVSTASEDGTSRLYAENSAPAGPALKVEGNQVSVAVISPDGTKIALASHNIIKIFDRATGTALPPLLGHESWILDLAWTPDGSRLVSVSEDTMAVGWDARTSAWLHAFKGHTARIRAVAVSPDGRRAATAGDDARIHIWDLANGQLLHTLPGHELRIKALAWSGGGLLASAGSDDFIKLWDSATGRELGTLRGLTQEVWTLQFAPTRFLAAGSVDGMAVLFDLETGKPAAAFPCADAVQAFWFSADGTEVRLADRGGANLIPNIHVLELVPPARN